jgi:hypothetical protein
VGVFGAGVASAFAEATTELGAREARSLPGARGEEPGAWGSMLLTLTTSYDPENWSASLEAVRSFQRSGGRS